MHAVDLTGTDRYPTRFAYGTNPPTAIHRCDTVVRGSALELADATGAEDAARRFDADGYLSLPGFFSDSLVAACRSEAHRLEQCSHASRPPEAFFERGSNTLRSVFDVLKFSPLLADLAHHPRLLQLARALLGDEPYLHQTRINYKPAYRGTGFFWHSDFETWHAEDGMPDMRAVSVSIALSENTPFNGPLLLVPGSHRQFLPCVGETPMDHYTESLVAQKVGTPSSVQLDRLIAAGGIQMATGPAGSIVVFDCNTLHGSNDNLSATSRINLFFVYNARCNALRAPYAARKARPPFIAARPQPQAVAPPLTP